LALTKEEGSGAKRAAQRLRFGEGRLEGTGGVDVLKWRGGLWDKLCRWWGLRRDGNGKIFRAGSADGSAVDRNFCSSFSRRRPAAHSLARGSTAGDRPHQIRQCVPAIYMVPNGGEGQSQRGPGELLH